MTKTTMTKTNDDKDDDDKYDDEKSLRRRIATRPFSLLLLLARPLLLLLAVRPPDFRGALTERGEEMETERYVVAFSFVTAIEGWPLSRLFCVLGVFLFCSSDGMWEELGYFKRVDDDNQLLLAGTGISFYQTTIDRVSSPQHESLDTFAIGYSYGRQVWGPV
ncbi:hypothetical protein EJ02DRAFT_420578 [Clathrospora elynae]|uniref:Uncharacterized protein n=1 Tax=Clathrospora elynae TaxID=706981 RepID=A0A6A5SUR8_9PLEO|nr:hypothetical protein EJ02DRAFT_420578 [Clathrospora elynae]